MSTPVRFLFLELPTLFMLNFWSFVDSWGKRFEDLDACTLECYFVEALHPVFYPPLTLERLLITCLELVESGSLDVVVLAFYAMCSVSRFYRSFIYLFIIFTSLLSFSSIS